MALVLVLSSGCGVSPEDSRALWGSVQKSFGAGGNTQALSVSVDLEVECARGGEADIAVRLDIDDDSPLFDLTVLFGYDIGYDACQPDENTLDGELHYAASVIADETDSGGFVQIRTVYEGTVVVSGEQNGTCEIDMTADVDAAAYERPGDEFEAGVQVVYDGTLCGHEADEVLSVDIDS